jgi:hypothetical protein
MSQGDLSGFFGGQGFDPNSVEPPDDFSVLPPGKYPVIIEAAETKATKAETGHYLELRLCVLDGPGKGRKIWHRMNIDNPSPIAVKIARQELSSLCKATIGSGLLVNENQFNGQTCVADVKVKDGENSIRAYSSFADAQSVQQVSAVQQQAGPSIPVRGNVDCQAQQHQQQPIPSPQYPQSPPAVVPAPAVQYAQQGPPTLQPTPPAVSQPVQPAAAVQAIQPTHQQQAQQAPDPAQAPPWNR